MNGRERGRLGWFEGVCVKDDERENASRSAVGKGRGARSV